jgi:hypothetical protein
MVTSYCKSTCLNASSATSAGRAARASTNAWAYGSVAASCRSKNASSRSPTGLPSKNWHGWKASPEPLNQLNAAGYEGVHIKAKEPVDRRL